MLKLVCTLLDLMLNQTNKNWYVQYEANQETYMIASLCYRDVGVI